MAISVDGGAATDARRLGREGGGGRSGDVAGLARARGRRARRQERQKDDDCGRAEASGRARRPGDQPGSRSGSTSGRMKADS